MTRKLSVIAGQTGAVSGTEACHVCVRTREEHRDTGSRRLLVAAKTSSRANRGRNDSLAQFLSGNLQLILLGPSVFVVSFSHALMFPEPPPALQYWGSGPHKASSHPKQFAFRPASWNTSRYLRLWFKELRSEIGLFQAITLPPFVSPFLLPFPLPPFLLYVLIEKNILNAKQKLSMIGSKCYTPGTGTIKCQRVQLTKLYFHSKSDCQNSHDPNTLTSQAGMFPLCVLATPKGRKLRGASQ